MKRICIIDIGTNSMLSLVVEKSLKGSIIEKEQRLKSIGLGRYLGDDGNLSKNCLGILIDTLNLWKKEIEALGKTGVKAVGTYIFRIAENGEEICSEIEKSTGIYVDILTEEQEAFYGFLGATWGQKLRQRVLTVDIGGGSTEFVNSAGGSIKDFLSIDFGVVSSTKEFFKNDPPEVSSIQKLRKYVLKKMSELSQEKFNKPDTCICMGGTATTLAALYLRHYKYNGSAVQGTVLSKEQIEKFVKNLSEIKLAERKKVIKIDPERAYVIVAGAVILRTIMDFLSVDECTVSDRGVPFGIALQEL